MDTTDALRFNTSVLDQIEFKDILVPGLSPSAAMKILQGKYEDHELTAEIDTLVESDIMRGYICNCMTEIEFMEYCTSRYNCEWKSETRYWLSGINA